MEIDNDLSNNYIRYYEYEHFPTFKSFTAITINNRFAYF